MPPWAFQSGQCATPSVLRLLIQVQKNQPLSENGSGKWKKPPKEEGYLEMCTEQTIKITEYTIPTT